MLESVLFPVISIAGLSLLFGALLGFSAKKFAVKVNPKIEQITSVLPGVNCGGCGFPGCAVFAEAVAKEEANYRGCSAGGSSTAVEIAKTMGIDPEVSSRKVAFIKCNGIDDNVKRNYLYDGPKSCVAASQLATGGNKSCAYSCIGLASCKNACSFDAIQIIDSIARVDTKKCTACGRCVTVCPKKLIEIVPDKAKVRVLCNSRDKGRVVRINCRAGCIGCTLCQKSCETGAITVVDNIAHIDYEKCILCLKCVDKCPAKVIKVMP
jgi:Na+-translocating ferredoxin:NAD+ oxidoreductase RNF subunit RnfB